MFALQQNSKLRLNSRFVPRVVHLNATLWTLWVLQKAQRMLFSNFHINCTARCWAKRYHTTFTIAKPSKTQNGIIFVQTMKGLTVTSSVHFSTRLHCLTYNRPVQQWQKQFIMLYNIKKAPRLYNFIHYTYCMSRYTYIYSVWNTIK